MRKILLLLTILIISEKINSQNSFAGDLRNDSIYKTEIPTNPTPIDNALEQPLDITLSWKCKEQNLYELKYDIYFGIDNPPTQIIAKNNYSKTLERGGLKYNTDYYWRVIAKDKDNNDTQEPVWKFKTYADPCDGIKEVNYEGEIYKTVAIENKCWLTKNLNIGTRIDGIQNQTNNQIIEKYCYDDNPKNCESFGGLYQWDEVMQYTTQENAQGICTKGWHIPTLVEFETLQTTLNISGNELKAVGQGTGNGIGTNASGFAALMVGLRRDKGKFGNFGEIANF
jgi:uncharacterized protein (TIGR02145 family)